MSDIIENPNVDDPNEVIRFSQQQLVKLVTEGNMEDKQKISALSALSKTALTQNRLKQDASDSKIQQEINQGILAALDSLDVSPGVVLVTNRARTLTVDLPPPVILPGETSVIQEEIPYAEVCRNLGIEPKSV